MKHMNRTVLVGLAALAVGVAGCESKAKNPVAPTVSAVAATPAAAAGKTDAAPDGTTDAAPDGTTLKVTAPTNVSPGSGEKTQTVRPTLVIGNSTGRHATAAPTYQFELSNATAVLYTSGAIAQGTNQTTHAIPLDLAFETDYRYRARAVQPSENELLVGPWSAYTNFRSPDTPIVIAAPALATPADNQVLVARQVDLVVTNGAASGPSGLVVTYRFDLASDQNFANMIGTQNVTRGASGTTTATFANLNWNSTYFWRVIASAGTVTVAPAGPRTFRTPPDPTLPVPTPTPTPTPGGGGIGPARNISINEALSIIIDVHNRLGWNLGSSSSRESRIEFIYSAVATIHYGHAQFNPAGPDSGWCVKDAGGGRPPSDDVIVRCGSRDAWDLIGGAGANGYSFHLDYLGVLPGGQNVYAPPRGSLPAGGGSPTPPPGNPSIPLPNAQGFVRAAIDGRPDLLAASCPGGVKYRNNPLLDYVVDLLRLQDPRWGYNRKPTRTPADNGGLPVIAAGDELAYYFGTGTAEGSGDVYLVDILENHCGSTPARPTWRVFTGEEPGIWTSLGRFSFQ